MKFLEHLSQGKFYLIAGKQYLALPLNGNWDNKYAVANNNAFGIANGGDFGFNFSDNFRSPAVTGIYNIKLDFQAGKFTVFCISASCILCIVQNTG